MSITNPIEVLQKESPEVARSFFDLIDSLVALDGLDEKTKHLIYIAICASKGHTMSVEFHVPMAKEQGATRKEVRDAILLSLAISGLTGVVSCLPRALEIYDKC